MFSDALDREAAWLSASDSLPLLVGQPSAPFQIVQARWPRMTATKKRGLYVLRHGSKVERISSQRSMLTHRLRLELMWPLSSGVGSAEKDQQAFEQAVDLVLQRIEGPLGDKTHGGRFLSVGEHPEFIDVEMGDPVQDVQTGLFTCRISYSADDQDFNN